MASSIVGGNAAPFETAGGSATLTGWAVGARTNGGVAVLCSHEQTAANRGIDTLAVDGVSFTRIGAATPFGTGSSYSHTEIWACDDASASLIVSSNPVLAVTMLNGGTGPVAGTIVTVTDVDQTLANWQAFFDSDGQLSPTILAGDLTGFAAGSLILGTYCDQTGQVSVNTAATGGDAVTEFTSSDRNFNGLNSRCVQFYAAAADSTPAIRVVRTSGSNVYQSLAIVGVPDYSAGGSAGKAYYHQMNQ